MNTWMSRPFAYPERPLDRGKVLDAETLARIGEWGRYKDVDGDGIPYRIDPGHRHAGVLHARLRPQREGPVQRAAGRLRQQHGPAGAEVRDGAAARAGAGSSTTSPAPRSASSATARATGRSRRAAISSRGRPACAPATCGCAPIRSPPSSTTFIDRYERVYVVEQNRDAQMLGLMRLDCTPERDRASCAACCTTTACRSTRAR